MIGFPNIGANDWIEIYGLRGSNEVDPCRDVRQPASQGVCAGDNCQTIDIVFFCWPVVDQASRRFRSGTDAYRLPPFKPNFDGSVPKRISHIAPIENILAKVCLAEAGENGFFKQVLLAVSRSVDEILVRNAHIDIIRTFDANYVER
nr:hypothetical protein [Rhizobium tubonense]